MSVSSASTNASGRSLRSAWWTRQPSAAKIEAYSLAITPPPSTSSVRGSQASERIESESSTCSWSIGRCAGARGREPVAITMRGAPMRSGTAAMRVTSTVPASRKRASPRTTRTPLRASCAVMYRSCAATTSPTPPSSSVSGRSSGSGSPCRRGRAARSRSVLLGIVPVRTQAPPTSHSRSTTQTERPALAACIAAFWPAGPEPITRKSKRSSASAGTSAGAAVDALAGLLTWPIVRVLVGVLIAGALILADRQRKLSIEARTSSLRSSSRPSSTG